MGKVLEMDTSFNFCSYLAKPLQKTQVEVIETCHACSVLLVLACRPQIGKESTIGW